MTRKELAIWILDQMIETAPYWGSALLLLILYVLMRSLMRRALARSAPEAEP